MRGFGTYTDWAGGWAPSEQLREEQHRAWRTGLAQPDAWTSVAEAGGAPIGVVRFSLARTAREGGEPISGMAHLGALFVEREWWGRGIGGALLRDAIDEMRARGFERVRLLAPEGNQRALDLYRRHGFERLGTSPEPIFGLAVVEHRLELTPR